MYFILLLLSLTINEKIEKAIHLLENRHKQSSYLQESINLLEEIIEEDKVNEEALFSLSRAYFTYGDNLDSKDEKIKYYEKGKEIAENLKKINEDNPEGHFYYAVNLGRLGQVRGVMKSLSSAPIIKREFEKTLELDEEHTGAMDGLAVLYYELPGIFGGSLDKSLEYLNRAIEIDSLYTVLYIDFAKVHMKRRDYETARNYLEKMLNLENPRYPADYILKDKVEAEKLLEELKNK